MPRRRVPHPAGLRFAKRFKELRLEMGLSLGDVADLAGYSKGHLSTIEHGKCLVTIDTIERLAKGLQIAPADLLIDPEEDLRSTVIEQTRSMTDGELREILSTSGELR